MLVLLTVSAVVGQDNRLEELIDSAYYVRLQADFDANFRLLSEAESLKEIDESPVLQAKLYAELSKHYLLATDYDRAKEYADRSLIIAAESRVPLAEAYGHVALANYYNFLNVGDLTVDHAQQALDISRAEYNPAIAARANYLLYGVYSRWDNLELCNRYARAAISAATEAGDEETLANALSGYSVVMEIQYNHTDDHRYLDSMQHYLRQSINVYNEHPQEVGIRTYAIANINLANYYFQYGESSQPEVQDSVIAYAERARQAYQLYDKSYEIMGNVNGLLSEVAKLRGDDRRAESFLMDAYIGLTEAETPSYYTLSNVAQGLSDLYARRGNHRQALFYQQKKEAFNQQIFDEAEMMNTRRLEAQYENTRLLEQVEAAEQMARNRRMQNWLLGGISLLLLVVLVLLRMSFRSRSKLHLEEQARLKAEQDLLQLQKEQLQKEAMADALQIERKNRLLHQLKTQVIQGEAGAKAGYIDKAIKAEMRLEEQVEKSVKAFEAINPEFFNKLKEQSDGKLTPLEMKHCAYIHLQLNTKQIAAAFHIEPKSVRVSKYRIKQKLRLDKSVDLDRYLHELV